MPLTKTTHQLIKDRYKCIDFAIDATCGNGFDTLFLAGMCSDGGQVFSFDIQEGALDNTEKLLADNNISMSVMLINAGHENMGKLIKPKVDVVMFNLGFLPNSDSKICTKPETTIPALGSACSLTREGGMITVICYPGTNEGRKETGEVVRWMNGLDSKNFSVSEHLSQNPDESTPVLYVLEKL